jgi:hypothetical protein
MALSVERPTGASFPAVALRIVADEQTHTLIATSMPHEVHRIRVVEQGWGRDLTGASGWADLTGAFGREGRIAFQGDYGVVSEKDDQVRSITMVGATRMEVGDVAVEAERGWIEAEIEVVDRARNEVTVGLPPEAAEIGRFITIVNEVRSVAYRVEEVREEGGRSVLRLDQAPNDRRGRGDGLPRWRDRDNDDLPAGGYPRVPL